MTYRTERTVMKHGRAWGHIHTPCRIEECPAHAGYDCDDCNRPVCIGHLFSLGSDWHRCTACTATLLANLSGYRLACAGCGKLTDASQLSRRIEIVEGLQRHQAGLWCQTCV